MPARPTTPASLCSIAPVATSVAFEQVGTLEAWRYGQPGAVTQIPADTLGEDAWQFADAETRTLLERVRRQIPTTLETVAEILRRCADERGRRLHPAFRHAEDAKTTSRSRGTDRDWPIEKAILRPCLHDAPLPAFARPSPNAWIIFPYDLAPNARGRSTARLIQPQPSETQIPPLPGLISKRAVRNWTAAM